MVTARTLNKRSTTILIAVVLALGTGLLLFNYLSTVSHTADAVPMRGVVIATHDIPPHTLITPAMITVANRPQDAVDTDASSNPAAVAGQISYIDIPAGSTLSASKIGRVAAGGLTMRVPVGQRAISIALDPVKGVANLMQPGDHVDVIAVTLARGSNEAPRVATILRNKTLLAMGSTMDISAASEAANATSSEAAISTATLAVLPREAKILALADLNATLRLALRSPGESNRVQPGDPFVIPVQTQASAVAPAPAAAAPRPAAPAPIVHKAAPRGIPMIDGDQVR